MPFLVNLPHTNTTLLSTFIEEIQKTTNKNAKREFYGLTCYFDTDAILKLAQTIKETLQESQGDLSAFNLVVDISDWVKNRVSEKEIKLQIAKITKLPESLIKVIPINFESQLLHAKGYCLISPKKINNNWKGFGVITSGNLTKRGFGIEDKSNIELTDIIYNEKIEDFVNIIVNLTNNHKASANLLAKQNEFLLALRILREGNFYHKWEGSLTNEIRYKLTLTKKGIRTQSSSRNYFGRYKGDSKSISIDPLDLHSKVFSKIQKPFPQRFWANYSIDTLLGRWVPIAISEEIDSILDKNIKPYITEIQKATSPAKLQIETRRLTQELKDFKTQKLIKEDDCVIEKWKEKIEEFRENTDLIKLRILNYELIPEMLDSVNRPIIIKTFKGIRSQLNLRDRTVGVKSIINNAITNGAEDFDRELHNITEKAKTTLLSYK